MAEASKNNDIKENLEKVRKLLIQGDVLTALKLLDSKPLNNLNSPSIFELKYPNTDIKGRVVNL